MPPVRFAEPRTWRKYHMPRDSSLVSSTVNSCVPSGKWPQKMIMYDHTLRIRLAVRLPVKTNGANGPASSGKAT